MISKCLLPKIKDLNCLITDCKSSYESVAIKNKWNLIQVKSGGYVYEFGNSLVNINSIHSELSTFISRFRGVSIKHLQGCLDWFVFDKMMSYILDDNNSLMRTIIKGIVTLNTSVSSKNFYNNFSGINFDNVYSNYA